MKKIDANLVHINDIDMRQLLGREEVVLDKYAISEFISNRTILVTGGAGSIGSELCRQIAKFKPYKLIILDIYENTLYDLQQELLRTYPTLNFEVTVASVRDSKRIKRVFDKYRPEIVFHAAAHKHVPLMELDPWEAVKNNIKGTYTVATIANSFDVKKFVLISTDKAVNPTNVMGATKRFCEMIIQALQPMSKTEYSAVRFGNVLGSNGSVVPLFKKQIAQGGPITLTHKDVTRYFMTIPEAAQLILQSGTFAKGGETFILDMGKSVKIYDLAKNMIRLSGLEPEKDIKIEIVGLRPGEKLYEELLMDGELKGTSHEKIFIAKSGEFNLCELNRYISDLLDAAELEDVNKLKSILKEAVPTYTGGSK